jgi:hypothetical protein
VLSAVGAVKECFLAVFAAVWVDPQLFVVPPSPENNFLKLPTKNIEGFLKYLGRNN